ncbi:DoxX family protein [Oricola thermophila]|uniref:DoxX family protein n=1 Tax=Oricola thermophila TaxID=2742145 RepID=A0A6N1VE84_9HYPH|nr:DoxX family protein [Oricola thermophila]QKV19236.1 DoxX family protein [Oricola thermophila]
MSNAITLLLARILLAVIFIMSGWGKLFAIDGTAGYIASVGLPAATLLAWAAAIFELVAGLAILVGFRTREAAWLLAAFCVFAGFVFHFQPEDQMQMISFMKNLAIAGGFLSLAVAGAGTLSVDAKLGTARTALA